MKKEIETKIYSYLKIIADQEKKHSNYIDYYELFNITKSMDINQIKESFKEQNLRLLFHPDQIAFIGEEFKDIYTKGITYFNNAKDVFSNDEKKSAYDNFLEQAKINENSIQQKKQDIKDLEMAIEATIYKHGFYHGYYALEAALKGEFCYISAEGNARKKLQSMGARRIQDVIYKSRNDIMDEEKDNITMDFYSKIINKPGLSQRASSFYEACLETAIKYDLNGTNQLEAALSTFINQPSRYDVFTNQHSARDELRKNGIKPTEATILMGAKMHSLKNEKIQNSFSNYKKMPLIVQVKMFSNEIKSEATKISSRQY